MTPPRDRAAHTPGPWTFGPVGSFKFGVSAPLQFREPDDPPEAREPVATVDSMACSRDGQAYAWCEANARLIAAAPDLLAALRDLLAPLENGWKVSDMQQRIDAGRAALSRAAGAERDSEEPR